MSGDPSLYLEYLMKKNETKTTHLKDYKVPDYLIEAIDLEFNLDEEFTTVKALLDVHLNPLSRNPSKNLVLQGETLQLLSVSLNGETVVDYEKDEESLTIYNVPEKFSLTIETRIKPQENTALTGLYKSSGNFCTQCEAQGFRRITYFLDRPDVMSRYTTTIIADEKRYPILLSNGNLIATEKLANGKHQVKWQDPFKKPCYLFALVAGDLECVEDSFITQSDRSVILRLFVEKGNVDKCAHAMNAVKKAMRWDEEHFGREYDLDIYMIVAVSDFNAGAMENKGLNIFNTQYVLAKAETATDLDYIHIEAVIAHEYFHNWTGNRITCRDWFQLSLKEGLTVFRDQSFTQDMTSKTVARINDVNGLRNSQFTEDAGPLAHPVQPDSYEEINNFYTSTVYEKGAEVIRMQQTILGNELFRKGMDLYFARHDGQAVTIEEFVKSMEDAAKIDLSQFRLWYKQAGTPVLTVRDHYDAKTKTYSLSVSQDCPPTPGQPEKKPFHIPIKVGLIDVNGNEILQEMLQLKQAQQEFQFPNIAVRPVPSLLREFSAPVKLNYPYSDVDLELLFKHDKDLFNRWEAGQKYSVNLILRLIQDFHAKKTLIIPQAYIASFEHSIATLQQDKLLLAEMLTLPSEKYIGEQMEVIDVEAIHVVREYVLTEIAKQLKSLLIEQYQQNNDLSNPYQFDIQDIGKRHLTNRCLSYLAMLHDEEINEKLILRQFDRAMMHNMTDTIAALRCIVNSNMIARDKVLQEFYIKWQNDALVMDKWFMLQATSKLPDTIQTVKKLAKHPAFDIKNPNKVYSLVGGFCHRNPIRFHAADGGGYQLLTDFVLQLDVLNPQIAARMVTAFSDFRRYDKNRQQMIHHELESITKCKTISKNVSELVNKSLQ